ncbi:MAG: universal stress protein [Gemmatimonadetes bacterium]|nr:universal stress protein [Gemmatimonadota bacterium]
MSKPLVLCTTDLSEEEERVWPMAAELLHRLGARARVLHVIEPFVIPYASSRGGALDELREKIRGEVLDEMRKEVHARLEAFQRRWSEARPELDIDSIAVVEGNAAEMILLEAERSGAFLITVGHRLRGPIPRMLLGSVAERIVLGAQVPVVVIPTPM